jgi:hypothetical protein
MSTEEEINFDVLSMKIPDIIKTYSADMQKEIFDYLSSLDDINRKGYEIAFDHLGTSFSITRSNGFKQWKTSRK